MTDRNDRIHEAVLQVAGVLGLRHALPPINHVYINPSEFAPDSIVIAMSNRRDVDRVAEVLGIAGEPSLVLLGKGAGSYVREDERWRIVADETAPFEPMPGDDVEIDVEQAAGGSTFGIKIPAVDYAQAQVWRERHRG